ncbi:sn-glycerol-3-phosphate transporter [Alkalimarinus sediminis]|uniref:Sn-glycerol-3-phosphate transporter n=1 Tax=Alkalimarinus sediminis TaxID=1632866 RepID=A0A9E8HIY5_9ALTE|nr:sn-glycerol-3-phosphate transporter [Alkalimarinus sediminis]UZW73563.1 sn-glycerol-3-phosphate transporter [Alkalimarinus sediminis]
MTRNSITQNLLPLLSIIVSIALLVPNASADWLEEGDQFYFQTSLYTVHYDPQDEHNNKQELINVEFQKASQWLGGLALFKNSFGQSSQFAYLGYNWTIPYTREFMYFKFVGGLMHGYDGQYKDKIPLNQAGIAPAVLPSIGVKYKRVHSEIALFGAAGAMWTIGFNFPISGEKE